MSKLWGDGGAEGGKYVCKIKISIKIINLREKVAPQWKFVWIS